MDHGCAVAHSYCNLFTELQMTITENTFENFFIKLIIKFMAMNNIIIYINKLYYIIIFI